MKFSIHRRTTAESESGVADSSVAIITSNSPRMDTHTLLSAAGRGYTERPYTLLPFQHAGSRLALSHRVSSTPVSVRYYKGAQTIRWERFICRCDSETLLAVCSVGFSLLGVFIHRGCGERSCFLLPLLLDYSPFRLLSPSLTHTHTHTHTQTCGAHPSSPTPTARPHIRASCCCHGNQFHPVSTCET